MNSADILHRLTALFRDQFGRDPVVGARAPGRVNLIGEHTDYNDGFVLPCAIARQTMVVMAPRDDGIVDLVAGDLNNARTRFSVFHAILPDAATPWANYVRGMVHLLMADGMPFRGADIAILGDMPQGAGLSSSAALECAVGFALLELARMPIDPVYVARIGQGTEHEFAGCQCGIMDQMTSACAVQGSAMLLDCRTLDIQAVTIPDDMDVLIVHSGVTRGLVDGEYNARRADCEAAAAHLGVASLRDADLGMLDAAASTMPDRILRRARHIITENARVLALVTALESRDRSSIARLMAESHASMRDDFEITIPPIDALVGILAGALGKQGGARMTGGGFGGAVVALVPRAMLGEVMDAVYVHYRTPDGAAPDMIVETPAAGASILLV